MTFVKAEFPLEETHAPLLMGLLFRQVHTIFDQEDWGGLRQSHFRVISSVPSGGVSITELGERLGMTNRVAGSSSPSWWSQVISSSRHTRQIAACAWSDVRRWGNGCSTGSWSGTCASSGTGPPRSGRRGTERFEEALEELALGGLPE